MYIQPSFIYLISINEDDDEIDNNAERDSRMDETPCNFIDPITATEEEVFFITGSSCKGTCDALGMSGVKRYVMPNGTIYEGKMFDGMFHGNGSFYWPETGQRLDVVHDRGKLLEHKYTFADGLTYDDVDWKYCKFPDRRFYESTKRGLRPGGRTLRTAKKPTKILPSGCYDTGDGVYDPKTLTITSYDDSTKVLRTPTKEEHDWILKYCRKSWSEPTGYRVSLIENWSENPPELPYNLAMSEDSPDLWWKRPETCFCGQYVLLGEPCKCKTISVHSEIEAQNELSSDKRNKSFRKEIEKTFTDSFLDYGVDERNIGGLLNASESESTAELSIQASGVSTEKWSSGNFFDNLQQLDIWMEEVQYDQFLTATKKGSENKIQVSSDEAMRDTKLQINAEEKLRNITEAPINAVEEKLDRSSEINHEIQTAEHFLQDELLQQSAIHSRERINKSEVSSKTDELTESTEKDFHTRIKIAADIGAEKEAKNSDTKNKYPQISAVEIGDGFNSRTEILSHDEMKTDKQVHKNEVEKLYLHKFSDTSHEERFDKVEDSLDEKKVVEESNKEEKKSRDDTIVRKTTLENDADELDYVTTISREKVLPATEAKAADARGSQTELLLPKTRDVAEKSHSRTSGSIEDEGTEKYLPFYRVVADATTFRRDIVAETSTKLVEDIQIVSGLEKSTENHIVAEKLEEKKTKDFHEKVYQETVEKGSKLEISQITEEISQEIENLNAATSATFESSRFDDSYDRQNSSDLTAATKKIASTVDYEMLKKNFSFSRDKSQSHALAKAMASNEKDVIEIYSKFPRKQMANNKCSGANVWRLSTAMRDYNSNEKTLCHSCGLQRTTNKIASRKDTFKKKLYCNC